VLSLLTVVSGTGMFLFLDGVLGFGQTLSLYLSVPAALPFAVSGFLKIHGMPLKEYLKQKRSVTQQLIYRLEPEILEEDLHPETEQTGKAVRKKEKRPVLETREEMTARMTRIYEETNAGL